MLIINQKNNLCIIKNIREYQFTQECKQICANLCKEKKENDYKILICEFNPKNILDYKWCFKETPENVYIELLNLVVARDFFEKIIKTIDNQHLHLGLSNINYALAIESMHKLSNLAIDSYEKQEEAIKDFYFSALEDVKCC